MKKTKSAILVMLGALVLATVAILSCKKDSVTPGPAAPVISSFTPTHAGPGATITITGTNFTGATAVSFGGTAATSFTVVSSTSITAVLAQGATGSVSVITAGGTATLAGFTYDAPLPNVDGYASSNEVEAPSLIAHWPFDGNLTETIHTSTPVLTGGSQTFVTGRIGQAVHLAAGWMTYGPQATAASASNTPYNSNDTLQNGFTISVWAQVPATALLSNLFQLSAPNIPNWPILGLNYRKHADSTFDIDGGLANVDGTGPHLTYAAAFMEPAFRDSLAWAHIAITYDGSDKTMRYYANGILRRTINLITLPGGPFPDPAASLLMIAPNYATIGTFEANGRTPGDASTTIPGFMADGITGNVDDIRFFRKRLTDQKISDLYILGNQGR